MSNIYRLETIAQYQKYAKLEEAEGRVPNGIDTWFHTPEPKKLDEPNGYFTPPAGRSPGAPAAPMTSTGMVLTPEALAFLEGYHLAKGQDDPRDEDLLMAAAGEVEWYCWGFEPEEWPAARARVLARVEELAASTEKRHADNLNHRKEVTGKRR